MQNLRSFKLLIDTCVWLDLAKDHRQEPLLEVLEELVDQGRASLLLPRTIMTEFSRNKARIIEESGRSLSSALKRAKEIIGTLGRGQGKRRALAQLDEVDHQLPQLGEVAIKSIKRIEKLFARSIYIEASDAILVRAAQRAIERKAPFHRQRNGIDDAILIETYSGFVNDKSSKGVRFGFVTHNTKDFSHPSKDNRLPHPDLAVYFSKIKSLYFISLAEALNRVEPALVTDIMMQREWEQEPRRLTEILNALEEFTDKVWYGRHQFLMERVDSGEIEVVEREELPVADRFRRVMRRDIFLGALKAGTRVEKKYGIENLGPWSDFEWGMLNGKLSALRWVLGDEWDFLDT